MTPINTNEDGYLSVIRLGKQFDESKEKYILPIAYRALAELDGSPQKGNKSKWTDKLEAHYNIWL